jgi:hypothetical protein
LLLLLLLLLLVGLLVGGAGEGADHANFNLHVHDGLGDLRVGDEEEPEFFGFGLGDL